MSRRRRKTGTYANVPTCPYTINVKSSAFLLLLSFDKRIFQCPFDDDRTLMLALLRTSCANASEMLLSKVASTRIAS